MKLRTLFYIFFLFILFILNVFISGVNAEVPYRSYLYDFWENAVSAPQAYLPERVIDGIQLGVGKFNEPRDFQITEDKIYIVDTGNNRLVITDHNWQYLKTIDEFVNGDQLDFLDSPRGVAVMGDRIYVADRNNERVLILDQEGNYHAQIDPPLDLQGEEISFRPLKVAVNDQGTVYVIADGVYDGIMEFDSQGQFRGFLGAPQVSPDPVDYIWYRISTDEQRERMTTYLPTEFSNLDVDARGFVYTTVFGFAGDTDSGGFISGFLFANLFNGAGSNNIVKMLNPAGEDQLRRTGFHPPVGDIDADAEGAFSGDSLLVDIAAQEAGVYSILDANRGRVFTYDRDGNLLYIFGGRGDMKGVFREPVALENSGDKLVVLDRRSNQLIVFKPTEYARNILAAINQYQEGHYNRSAEIWEEVIKQNLNFDLAYSGVGRILLREENFPAAMVYFEMGQHRANYSRAFYEYRREVIRNHFSSLMVVLLVIIVIILVFYRFLKSNLLNKKRKKVTSLLTKQVAFIEEKSTTSRKYFIFLRTLKNFKYAFYVIFHPFDGFWTLKQEKKGDYLTATILLFLLIATYIFVSQYTGFIFNLRRPGDFNMFREIFNILLPFFIWSLVNWALTTLLDGKGTFKDIFVYTCFSFTPLILINLPVTVISNYLTADESMIYNGLLSFALIWFIALLLGGTIVTHEFGLSKALITLMLILIGIGTVLFIALLFFSVGGLLYGFFSDIYAELTMRT